MLAASVLSAVCWLAAVCCGDRRRFPLRLLLPGLLVSVSKATSCSQLCYNWTRVRLISQLNTPSNTWYFC
jgi:hypothetical protein